MPCTRRWSQVCASATCSAASGPWLDAAAEHALAPVFLVAPSSSKARIKLITASCGGFVYAASVMGTTGARSRVSSAAAGLVQRTREHTQLPVAVGLGVSTAAQAAEVAAFADGAIVGTAFVRCLLDAPDSESGRREIAELTADLASGVRMGNTPETQNLPAGNCRDPLVMMSLGSPDLRVS